MRPVSTTASAAPGSGVDLDDVDAYWRAANYLSAGQIYLLGDDPLLRRPLRLDGIKPRLLGHWGTTPGLNFVYAHVNRVIAERRLDAIVVVGPGHGGPAALAAAWLDGGLGDVDGELTRDADGMSSLFRRFSHPYGLPSHAGPQVPGSMHEGGELGYSLAHATGAVLDQPELVAVCVIGDGEAETGPLAASWQAPAFVDPAVDGAVLPVLHLNGYKIANPTVLGRSSDDDVDAVLGGHGWSPIHVTIDADTPSRRAHDEFAAAMDRALDMIGRLQASARSASGDDAATRPRWPLIVLRSPKGWTGPARLDGDAVEGTWRSHQVPIEIGDDVARLEALDGWLRSYRPDELFDDRGRPRAAVVGWLPTADRRLGANPHTTGGRRPRDLELPDVARHARSVDAPGATSSSPTGTLGDYLRGVVDANRSTFRLVGPDETASNRLDAVFEATDTVWQLERRATDEHLGRHGRVMEVLSEHLCQGWLEGYVLTGRHGVFSCYEAFAQIVSSMFNQHAKWLQVSAELPWRRSVPSLNYLLTSHVWRQDHNGFSHQDPGFVDHVASKPSTVTRLYLPPDANCLLQVMERCLLSRDLINVVVAGKHPSPDWLDIDAAAAHVDRGFGVWSWAGRGAADPDVVLACAGDVPTMETLAAAQLIGRFVPDLAVRVVNVVDLLRLQSPRHGPHGAPDAEFDAVFGTTVPVVFAHHGYPGLIHRLTYDRACHPHLKVRGFREQGSTTTPFDMVVRNRVDRFDLALDVLDSLDRPVRGADELRRHARRRLDEHHDHVRRHGRDLDDVLEWSWAHVEDR